jgi:hypothetical protein
VFAASKGAAERRAAQAVICCQVRFMLCMLPGRADPRGHSETDSDEPSETQQWPEVILPHVRAVSAARIIFHADSAVGRCSNQKQWWEAKASVRNPESTEPVLPSRMHVRLARWQSQVQLPPEAVIGSDIPSYEIVVERCRHAGACRGSRLRGAENRGARGLKLACAESWFSHACERGNHRQSFRSTF